MSEPSDVRRRLSRSLALLRYHRPSQLAWRLISIGRRVIRRRLPDRWVFRSGHRSARWKPKARGAFRAIAQHRLGLWPGRASHVSEIAEGTFSFLNETRNLARGKACLDIDWKPQAPRLWRFHLQCHEYLPDLASNEPSAAYSLLDSWLNERRHQSPCRDPDAWHPFCISRRLPAWLSLLAQHDLPERLLDRTWKSLADQVVWLSKNCEWDLGGNHLLENLTTLFLAECFLDVVPAPNLGFVSGRLQREWREQVLPSGEHFERAPTYHALMMVCAAQCVAAADFCDSPERELFAATLSRMNAFAKRIRQPCGTLPLLGDSALDETPSLDGLDAWGESLGVAVDHEIPGESDYWIKETDRGDKLVFDVGPLACDHLPAHGHADLTQIVASLGGLEAIVDTGNFDYEPSEIRRHCRSTQAHNVLDWGEQCDFWSTFRMGRRGRPVAWNDGADGAWSWKSVAHDAYDVAAGRLVVACETLWIVVDWLDAVDNKATVRSRLHWHPQWQLTVLDDGKRVTARHDTTNLRYGLTAIDCEATIKPGVYCPNFGERHVNQLIELNRSSGTVTFGCLISLVPDGPDPPHVERRGRELTLDFGPGEVLTCLLAS